MDTIEEEERRIFRERYIRVAKLHREIQISLGETNILTDEEIEALEKKSEDKTFRYFSTRPPRRTKEQE